MTEGVDYSATPPGAAALRAAGKRFVVRYLAQDWRGLTPDELRDLTIGGFDVAVVYEEDVRTWEGGFATGVQHARHAQNILVGLNLPASMPIYFAVDDDATPGDQATIDAYLAGCASVLGKERVGVYGGYWIVLRCAQNKSAAWFWQTTAWSGGNIYAGNHLYQYAYGVMINGTDCDATSALKANFGQAALFHVKPAPPPVPMPSPVPAPKPKPEPKPMPTPHYSIPSPVVGPQTLVVLTTVTPRVTASPNAAPAGPPVPAGTKMNFSKPPIFSHNTQSIWLVDDRNRRFPAEAFTKPRR